jgi:hypothetical protein
MYTFIDPSVYVKAGNFELTDILLTSYKNPDEKLSKISLKNLIVELNIFESIFNNTLSGNIVLADANNIASQFPLTGLERLEFKLRSPGISRVFDFSEKSGHPMFIYKISDRKELSPRSQAYILHFCSKEAIRNEQIIMTSSYKNTIAQIASDILFRADGLQTKKTLFVEPTLHIHQYVIPSIMPFEALNLIAKDARSLKYNNAGYYFFETAEGFHFKSLESLLALNGISPRPSVARFESIPANVRNKPYGQRDVGREMVIIQEFEVLSQFDTLKNLRNGVYGSKLTLYNALDKTYSTHIFNYHLNFSNSFHTEYDGIDKPGLDKSVLPYSRFNRNKFVSDESATAYVKSNTTELHDNVEVPNQSEILQKRLSQRLAFETFKIQFKAHGFTGLSIGDIVTLILPSYGVKDKKDPKDQDPVLSGRYLVVSIRHQINHTDKKHYMYVECLKDSVKIPFEVQFNDTFTDRERDQSVTINQYVQDEIDINNNTVTGGMFIT